MLSYTTIWSKEAAKVQGRGKISNSRQSLTNAWPLSLMGGVLCTTSARPVFWIFILFPHIVHWPAQPVFRLLPASGNGVHGGKRSMTMHKISCDQLDEFVFWIFSSYLTTSVPSVILVKSSPPIDYQKREDNSVQTPKFFERFPSSTDMPLTSKLPPLVRNRMSSRRYRYLNLVNANQVFCVYGNTWSTSPNTSFLRTTFGFERNLQDANWNPNNRIIVQVIEKKPCNLFGSSPSSTVSYANYDASRYHSDWISSHFLHGDTATSTAI